MAEVELSSTYQTLPPVKSVPKGNFVQVTTSVDLQSFVNSAE